VTAEFTLPLPIAIDVVSSSIGPLDTQLLADGINDILKTIVLPWLNYRGQHQVLADLSSSLCLLLLLQS
jgi:hypothetical protein